MITTKAVMNSLLQHAADVESLTVLPLSAWPDGPIRLAVDVCNWLRPGAATSPGRLFCHVCGRGKGQAQTNPGWPHFGGGRAGAGPDVVDAAAR